MARCRAAQTMVKRRMAVTITLVTATLMAGLLWVNRPVSILINAPISEGFPRETFSHDQFETLLQRYVNSVGDVDYDSWLASPESVQELDSYLAAVTAFSPESAPERFPTQADELAYWIYAYNAYVIRSILTNWPVDSVTDLKAPIEAVKGLGFFYRNRYVFGGDTLSLLAVENDKIRKRHRDPRIHFVLNCGSESCPVLRPELPVGDELESLLQDAATDFIRDTRNVAIDDVGKVVALSAIFKMYEKDFVNDLRAKGLPASRGVIDYIASIAGEPLRSQLETTVDYEIIYDDFDWSVNVVNADWQSSTWTNDWR